MTPEEMKIWNAAVRKCADWTISGSTAYSNIRSELIPETEAERLALECPTTDKVEVIAWMLDRNAEMEREYKSACETLGWHDTNQPKPIIPEYVYGPEVPGTTTWPEGTEYQHLIDADVWLRGNYPTWRDTNRNTRRRRIYRIGQTYEHDGSNVCPLADGDQPVEVNNRSVGPAAKYGWTSITRFTPVKEG